MECKRCLYNWIPRKEVPKQCPKCKAYYYDKEREWEKKPVEVNKV